MSSHESERLSAYLDGELPLDERGEVEAHLAACRACAALLADMTAVDAAAASLPDEAPEGYFEAFPSRVVARLGAASRVPRRRRRLPAWTWAAAAALLLAVVAPLTLRRSPPGPIPPTTPAPLTPWPALEDRDQKAVREALSTPAAEAVPPAGPRPAVISPPAVALPAPPGAPAVAEERLAAGKASRNEAVSEDARGPLPPPAAQAEEGALSRSKRGDVPAESEVRQESAQVTSEGVEAPDGARGPARRSPAFAAAPMASAGPQDETAAGALAVPEAQRAFGRLEAWRPTTAAQWRRLREAWRGFVAAHPDGPRVDEARVRAIEAGREAWLAGGAGDDEAAFQRDARAYLEREDAVQKERVERLLVPPRP